MVATGNDSVPSNNMTRYQSNLRVEQNYGHGDVTGVSPYSNRQSASSTSVDANNYPIRHSSAERERQQQQQHQRKITSPSSTKYARPTSPREHQPHRSPPSPFGTAIGNTPMAAAVTPSPKPKGNALYGNEIVDGGIESGTVAMPTIDDGNGAWRKHGKIFRANIVLADEGKGGNSFALSDSCTIERYYRVADRVLEQFLSSNIAERNELIESYLVGNRLFKFLSVVLPTHHQYFSLDPKLEELRNRSESQLMELLEYMEELELMIDEMEYNRYILKDLTPSELKYDNTRGDNDASGFTSEMSLDDGFTNGEFLEESSDSKYSDDINNSDRGGEKDTAFVTKSKIPIQCYQEGSPQHQQLQQQQQGAGRLSSPSDSADRIFQGGNVKVAVQAIEASHQTQTDPTRNGIQTRNDIQSQHKVLKERVAAVLTASNNAEISNNSRRSMRSVSSSDARSTSLSTNVDKQHLDPFSDKSHNIETNRKLEDFMLNDTNFMDDQGMFQNIQSQSYQPEVSKDSINRQIDEPTVGDSFMSWDADFSEFNVFSTGNFQDGDSAAFDPKRTHIDLLLQDPCPSKQKLPERPKPLPKIKEPPVSHPRSVWDHAQVHAARLSSSFEGLERNMNEYDTELSPALSDCSSDIFNSLEDPGPAPVPVPAPAPAQVRTKIEERMERAVVSRNASGSQSMSFKMTHYEESSLVEAHSHRKIVNQIRGCVRCLLD